MGTMEPPLPNMVGFQSQPAVNYSDSVDSSPKSTTQQGDWDEPLPPVPGAKLRLMCSYGGHIIPRPHDKNLCYVGGETRIVVAERNTSLADLTARLSHSLLDNRKFTFKYQLPNEELDSLISVSTDEDLDNMIEEYDRIAANNSFSKSTSGRLRLFLFMAKPETAQTMGALMDDAQSESWFVDALNGADLLSRGLSDSAAAVGDLLRLDSDPALQQIPPNCSHPAAQPKVPPQDVHSVESIHTIMSDSPMVENTSSFDSTTSSPSMAHLPPIRVRVDEVGDGNTRMQEEMKGRGGLEEHFSSQLRVTPPPAATSAPSSAAVANAAVMNNNYGGINSGMNDDDQLSDQGMHGASRKPPLPIPMPQRVSGGFNSPSPNDSKNAAGFNLPSPDSVHSASSISSGISLTKTAVHHDQAQVTSSNENKPPITQTTTDQRLDNRSPSPQNLQMQPTQDPTKYMYPPQQHEQHQHQFIQENMHYIPAHSQMTQSYRPVYATQQQIHPQVDHQQYPMYYIPVNQNQPYNVAQPQTMTPMVQPSSVTHAQPPVYATRGTAAQTNNQYQQYLAYNNAVVQPRTGTPDNYGHFDYSQFDYGHNQVYYTGQLPPAAAPMATSQYQSITPAQAAMIAEASMQLPKNEVSKQPPSS
ncbi:uncharacterized protein LOC110702948 [Chenopodium quinoa]|uniref:PB1 domain-containing protein n=1 Tax=Chenopodium quinoa TaxID=63459 RepID=A0A803MIH4_CHEQI|nr:uncharacterized protein LOC110702948 [Chenopodium quinoa]